MTLKTTSTLWTVAMAALTITVAQGQDATRSGASSANQSSPATSTTAPVPPTSGPTAQDKPAATGSTVGAGTTPTPPGGKPAPICFKLTGRCVDPAKAPSGKAGAAAGTAPTKRPLNLNAPDVRSVVPADQLNEPLPTNDQITETQESQTVSVKGDKSLEEAPLGFGAIWWALNHPSQAWRIFTPVE